MFLKVEASAALEKFVWGSAAHPKVPFLGFFLLFFTKNQKFTFLEHSFL
jgi:hypothetical protein